MESGRAVISDGRMLQGNVSEELIIGPSSHNVRYRDPELFKGKNVLPTAKSDIWFVAHFIVTCTCNVDVSFVDQTGRGVALSLRYGRRTHCLLGVANHIALDLHRGRALQ